MNAKNSDAGDTVNNTTLHHVVLLLERLVIAIEKIAGAGDEQPVGKVWLSDVERECKPSAKRWFDLLYIEYPDIRYAEQVTEHHLNQWRSIRSDTREYIRTKIREMISQ